MAKMIDNEGQTVETKITYADLKSDFESEVAPELNQQERRNHFSALNQYQTYCGRADSDSIAPDFGADFDTKLTSFLVVCTPGSVANKKSLLRGKWKVRADFLFARGSQLHFGGVSKALRHYYDAAKKKEPTLTAERLATRVSAPTRSVEDRLQSDYLTAKEDSRSLLESLEVALGIPKGTLNC
jgi:hypothetical protein